MKILLIGHTSAIAQAVKPYLSDFEVIEQSSRERTVHDTDIVINFAGVSLLNDLSKVSLITKKLIEVNCMGAINILTDYLPLLRKKRYGRIILMSSVCAEIDLINHGAYSASKAFIDKLVKIAALENAQYGVTVNSIQLGYTGIGMSDIPEELERMRNKSALKRFCNMQELANTIKYIVETEYFTGQNLRLDGFIK